MGISRKVYGISEITILQKYIGEAKQTRSKDASGKIECETHLQTRLALKSILCMTLIVIAKYVKLENNIHLMSAREIGS